MLPVTIALPEPSDFDAEVRQPGLASMAGINIYAPLPDGTILVSYWKKCLSDLRRAFEGRCCFSGTYMRASEVIPVEHALPKKLHPNLAYEWSNFRYASSRLNSRKSQKYILDPACLPKFIDVYHLEFATGGISVNPAVNSNFPALFDAAKNTIDELGLDKQLYRDERMEIWDDYRNSTVKGIAEKEKLKKANNFVWYEANRQGLL